MCGHLIAHVDQSCRAREEEVWEKWLRFEVQRHGAYPWAGSQSRYHSGVKLTSQHSINSGEGRYTWAVVWATTKKILGKWETFLVWCEHSTDVTPSSFTRTRYLWVHLAALATENPYNFWWPWPQLTDAEPLHGWSLLRAQTATPHLASDLVSSPS